MPIHSLTPAQLAEREQISIRNLARMRANGTGPSFYKAGRVVRYPVSEVERWTAANLNHPVREKGVK